MTRAPRHYDIAIVGGGIAGCATACALSGLGLRIALIDAGADTYASDDGPERAIALSWGSRRHLDSLGVWPEIEARGAAPIRHVHVREPGRRPHVDMDRRDAGGDVDALGYVVQLAHVRAPLFERLRGCDDVEIVAPATLRGARVGEDGVTLELAGGRRRRLAAGYVVGADGTHSAMRRLAGIDTRGWDYNRFGLVASVRSERSHEGVAYECFRESGPLALLPLDEERLSIVWTLTPAQAARESACGEGVFLDRLKRAAGPEIGARLGRFVETGPRACFPLELRVARRFAIPRLALVGNAAHTVHPVAGQGMNLGLRDVAVLADVVRRTLVAGRGLELPVVAEEYNNRRAADVAAVAGFTEGTNAIFGSRTPPLPQLRGAGLAAMSALPGLRDLLMERAAGLAQLPELVRGEGDA